MPLEIVGAGLGRTGTLSLKLALEQLLGAPCYHMIEVFGRPDDVHAWQRAIDGDLPDWHALFDGYRAAVDWPVAAFWREIASAFPDAPVLLSTRSSAEAWWTSANATIFEASVRSIDDAPELGPHQRMTDAMLTKTFVPEWQEQAAATRAYEQHNADVRAEIPPERLVEWSPGDGWAPLCDALGVGVPTDPFPHANTTEDFRTMAGLDEPA